MCSTDHDKILREWNFVVIGWVCYEQEDCKISLNFEFDRNIVIGTSAYTAWGALPLTYLGENTFISFEIQIWPHNFILGINPVMIFCDGTNWAEVTRYLENNTMISSLSTDRQLKIGITAWRKLGIQTNKARTLLIRPQSIQAVISPYWRCLLRLGPRKNRPRRNILSNLIKNCTVKINTIWDHFIFCLFWLMI